MHCTWCLHALWNNYIHSPWLNTLLETNPALWNRTDFINWKKSTEPSAFIRSIWECIVMNVPDLPTPSLWKPRQHTLHIKVWFRYWMLTYLHITTMALFPVDIWTFWTRLAISKMEVVHRGTLCSGHFKYWIWVTVNPVSDVVFSGLDLDM